MPIFNLLNKQYDVTVSYSLGTFEEKGIDFKVLYIPGFRVSRFFIHKRSLHKIAQSYDVVIGYGDIGWLSLMALLFHPKRNYKLILWGIGVRASYDTTYGENTKWDRIRFYLNKKADAILFYSKDPIKLYLKEGFNEEQLHVANNTVIVNKVDSNIVKNTILFIGTLYKQKQIYKLLNSYFLAYNKNKNIPILDIIGDGDEYENIKSWISGNNLQEKIFLRGKIFDENILCRHFSSAIACISPGQAGLSVLKSMGYGVPYITKSNAITGGEIFNIENGINGLLYDYDEQLEGIMLDITLNKSKYIEMGNKAKRFYDSYRKPSDMVSGMVKAIEYVSFKQ